MRLVATGAAGIHQMRHFADVHFGGKFAHHLRRRRDFGNRFGLDVQTHQNGRQLHRSNLAFHHLTKQINHFIEENFALVGQSIDRFLRGKHD